MSLETTLVVAVILCTCLNVWLLWRYVRVLKVRLPTSFIAYLATTPFAVVIGVVAVSANAQVPSPSALFLENVFLYKILAIDIALMLSLLVDLPRCLDQHSFSKATICSTKVFGRLILLFSVYTMSFAPWVLIGSRYPVLCGNWIHNGFYGPLHWLSVEIPPYGWLVRELFWWGYGAV